MNRLKAEDQKDNKPSSDEMFSKMGNALYFLLQNEEIMHAWEFVGSDPLGLPHIEKDKCRGVK